METSGNKDTRSRPSVTTLFERAREGDRQAFDALFALAADRRGHRGPLVGGCDQ